MSMPKKKRRRGAQGGRPGKPEPVAAAPTPEAAEDEASKAARRAQQKREWADRKRKQDRGGGFNSIYIWGGAVATVVVLAVVGGVLLFSGGGDSDATPGPTPTADPRVAGLPIDTTITVNFNDDGQNVNPRYEPSTITANAGEVIEILTPNIGSVAHNLRIAGLNGEYEAGAPTSDDWVTYPLSVQPGEEGRIVVKIDQPGSYPFKCDFHPTQIGTLVLS